MSDIFKEPVKSRETITQRDKDSNDKQWYKDKIEAFSQRAFGSKYFFNQGGASRYKSQKINYDLFNNIISMADFKYIVQPFGGQGGELPATFSNRDIVSSKIKVLLGMETTMPFSWRVAAVNEEATTRREQEQFERIRTFVVNSIMEPIKAQITAKQEEQINGKPLSVDQQNQLQKQISSELASKTPDEVYRYMRRDHQDPAEVLANQLLKYLEQKESLKQKFNKGWKHATLAGEEVYWIGILNGEPVLKVVNPLRFDCDRSTELDYIEQGEWAVCEYRMTSTEIMKHFGSELDEDDVNKLYQYEASPSMVFNGDFNFDNSEVYNENTHRVVHINFMSLRKIGYLSYIDVNTGQEEMMIVPEGYTMLKEAGDISVEWLWIPEAHEGWKIDNDIYVYMRPVPGQHSNLDNLYTSKLSYYGASVDNLNSTPTSPMDRMKTYQYLYNIILYRIELLLASDKGKILLMNINAIPKKAGIDLNKWMYFLEANKLGFFDPSAEGQRGNGDATSMAKEIDMSLISNIQNYINLSEYIERRCGESVGVTKSMEGQTAPNESVSNNKQNLVQSSYIIRPYFELHNNVKANVISGLLEVAKVAYSGSKKNKLAYILDDMSYEMLNIDNELLENSEYGIFVNNAMDGFESKQMVMQLAQAALQNQRADISDILKIMNSNSPQEAQEILESAQDRKDAQQQNIQESQQKAQAEQEQLARESEDHKYDREEALAIVKESERRKTILQEAAMQALSFSKDTDQDDDGTPDILEVYKEGVKADIAKAKLDLDKKKFEHQKEIDQEKLKIDRKKASQKPASKK